MMVTAFPLPPLLGSTQGYSIDLSLAHLVICDVDLWIGSAITLLGSKSAYAMMLIARAHLCHVVCDVSFLD
jgi:hypothetical protein